MHPGRIDIFLTFDYNDNVFHYANWKIIRRFTVKMIYECPEAEIISFQAMEQLANLDVNLGDLEGELGIGSKDF